MFTGIITNLGEVRAIKGEFNSQYEITSDIDLASVCIGASICCSGVCLTVVEKAGSSVVFDVSNETLSKTTLKSWIVGDRVNLEQSMSANDQFGGHIVTGHIDGVSIIEDIWADGDSMRYKFSIPNGLESLLAKKGSVAINGVSLTINEVSSSTFEVNIIPHTMEKTTFHSLITGDRVNIEVDILARYVDRQLKNMR